MYPTNSCVKNKNVVYWDGGTPYYCWRPEGGVNVVNCADPVHGTTTWVNCCDQCHKDTNQNFEQQCVSGSWGQCDNCPTNSNSPPRSTGQSSCTCVTGTSGSAGGPCRFPVMTIDQCGAGNYYTVNCVDSTEVLCTSSNYNYHCAVIPEYWCMEKGYCSKC